LLRFLNGPFQELREENVGILSFGSSARFPESSYKEQRGKPRGTSRFNELSFIDTLKEWLVTRPDEVMILAQSTFSEASLAV